VSDSSFSYNRAATGAAISVQDPEAGLEVLRSVFAGNVATLSGGAIYIRGVNTYVIDSSTFLGNAVRPAPWSSTASYTVNVFTGSNTAAAPMWSIDDGEVVGLSAAQCVGARTASTDGVQRGLAP
jgi:hypothetical protein